MTRFHVRRKIRKACSKAKYVAVGTLGIGQENATHTAFSELVKSSTIKASALSLIGIASVVVASPSQAAVVNGGFETGNFSGWTTIGNTSIQTSAFGSGLVEGTFQALLSTGNTITSDSISDSGLETFLGLASGSLDGLGNGNATTGSAIKQTFTATAGDILSLGWNFLTSENTPSSFYNDFSFVTLGSLSELADTTFSTFVTSLTGFPNKETGYKNFSYTIPTTGKYTLGLGVTNVGDQSVSSGLLVDNVKVTPVPEPLTILGSLAAGGVGAALRRKYKQQQKETAKV